MHATLIHNLLAKLLQQRLAAIMALAEDPSKLHLVGELQLAVSAVRDEIARHAVKLGYGSETPLA